MKYRIISYMLVLVSIGLIVLGVIQVASSQEDKQANINFSNYRFEKLPNSGICRKGQKCQLNHAYYLLKYQTNIKEIDEVIEKINSDTQTYLKQKQKMVMDQSQECMSVYDYYNYKEMIVTTYDIYNNESYLNLTIQRINQNVCTNQEEHEQVQTWIYDKKKQKFLTQQEFKQVLNLDANKIKEAIEGNMQKQYALATITFSNLSYHVTGEELVYYDTQGNLRISYYDSNFQVYTSAILS